MIKAGVLGAASLSLPLGVSGTALTPNKNRFGMFSFHPDLKVYPEYRVFRVPGDTSYRLFSRTKDIPKILKAFEGNQVDDIFFHKKGKFHFHGVKMVWWEWKEIPNSDGRHSRSIFSSLNECKDFYMRKSYPSSDRREIETYYIINLDTSEIINLGEIL